jgi:hypothetical protein
LYDSVCAQKSRKRNTPNKRNNVAEPKAFKSPKLVHSPNDSMKKSTKMDLSSDPISDRAGFGLVASAKDRKLLAKVADMGSMDMASFDQLEKAHPNIVFIGSLFSSNIGDGQSPMHATIATIASA